MLIDIVPLNLAVYGDTSTNLAPQRTYAQVPAK